ncbi:MAG TPA: hypothetical protein PLE30_04400 [Candidatus Kapabacteria bacterium]|nr:hypothetical protein [Candidatus Kapabacteria bacterium]
MSKVTDIKLGNNKSPASRRSPVLIIFAVIVISFLGIIIAPKSNFKNDWDIIGKQYEESKAISDPKLRQEAFMTSLKEMIAMRNKYPEHARLYLNTAVIFQALNMPDSAFKNAYTALKKGGDGTVNQINSFAIDIMLKSTIQKAQVFFMQKDTVDALNTFKYANSLIQHPFLGKTIGSFYANFGSADSALKYLYQSYKLNNRDSEVFYFVGLTYYKGNKIDSAIYFLNQAITMNPNEQQAKSLINLITSQGNNENSKHN